MKILARRQACCSQDDQIGPLEKTFEVDEHASLADFLDIVVASRFLQFSSSHLRLSCRVAGQEVAKVLAARETSAGPIQYMETPAAKIAQITAGRDVEFHFPP